MSYDYLFNCLTLGNQKVGKTSILSKCFDNNFYSSYKDFFTKIIREKGKNVKIMAWDPMNIRPIMGSHYRFKCAVILVFDLTDEQSFNQLDNWMDDIKMCMDNDPLIILIGNKVDLVEQRKVSYESAKQYGESNSMHYIEVSAKNDKKKIDEIFELIVKLILIKLEENKIDRHGIIKGSDMCCDTYFNNKTGQYNIIYRDVCSGKLITVTPDPINNNERCC